ncbi:hypothetical protein K0M31_009521 [Melipona bicolor]|uniref:Uncharacterized protein n=1 Tax=Melipona bicolor TaxID=60889 RepID=A0AA40KJ36_9HYME|nr:hypothetical protein K0M31_009521 [Melipona bicolor]
MVSLAYGVNSSSRCETRGLDTWTKPARYFRNEPSLLFILDPPPDCRIFPLADSLSIHGSGLIDDCGGDCVCWCTRLRRMGIRARGDEELQVQSGLWLIVTYG